MLVYDGGTSKVGGLGSARAGLVRSQNGIMGTSGNM